MRIKAENLLRAERALPLIIDWDGVQVIASSYADEFVGKLFRSWAEPGGDPAKMAANSPTHHQVRPMSELFVLLGPVEFMARVRLIKMAPITQTLINKAIMQRTQQLTHRV